MKHYALIYPKQVAELVVVAAVPLIPAFVVQSRRLVVQQQAELDYRLNCSVVTLPDLGLHLMLVSSLPADLQQADDVSAVESVGLDFIMFEVEIKKNNETHDFSDSQMN